MPPQNSFCTYQGVTGYNTQQDLGTVSIVPVPKSPDWVRDYPSNGGDAIAYQQKGLLWDVAAKAGIRFKNYGEYIEYNTFKSPTGSTLEPQWIDFYHDTFAYESGSEKQLYNYRTVASHSPLPNLIKNTVQDYPQFDLGILDQFRVDI